jgi:hypothetical protein
MGRGRLRKAALSGFFLFALLLLLAGCESPLLFTVVTLVEEHKTSSGTPDMAVAKGSIGINSGQADAVPVLSAQTGTSSQTTFTIENLGNGNLVLTGSPRVAISGPNAAEFAIDTLPYATVVPGTNTSFVVSFSPASAAAGKTAIFSIENNDSDENPFTFTVTGDGVAVAGPEIQVNRGAQNIDDSGSYDFQNTLIGSPRTAGFTITNTGTPGSQLWLEAIDPTVTLVGPEALP